ncbi:TolC family protein [Flavobacterium sp. NKUCC04_CG]|uniref:TolC family protein n=1 Tax=Flavobacterium sp. NKUCC04_CG TaxID=2842121 RepID=UPI001C5AE48E|nr:TolC family protein [Flavobacterium sp. NKUCC04_CG]MBW3518342.1 TolC family protein [Flavobacterium sp. NKUCC04_CG]
MKNKWISLLVTCFLLLWVTPKGLAQVQKPQLAAQKITYHDFLNRIGTQNLGYLAERYNLDIADAEVEAAKIFPDPELSFGWVDNGERRMEMGYGFEAELSWDLELGGKRKARKNLANSQKVLATLELQNFFHELRAEATIAFLETLQHKMLVDVKQDSYESMKQISKSDSIRFSLGQISKVDAVQSRLETRAMKNEVADAENDWENSLLELKKMFASRQTDSLYIPEGNLEKFDRLFNLEELVSTARNQRTDYLVAKQNQTVSSNEVRLAQAERVVDLGLSLGVENNSFVRNAVAPTPGHTAVKAGISVPLKFSNKKDAGLKTALYEQKQAELEYRDVELELEKEIAQALRTYWTKQKQIQQFENSMLEEAKEVLDGITYSYQRGASSLLEVLNAQRTYNETREAYVEARFDYAVALVELEKAVGIWDIEF